MQVVGWSIMNKVDCNDIEWAYQIHRMSVWNFSAWLANALILLLRPITSSPRLMACRKLGRRSRTVQVNFCRFFWGRVRRERLSQIPDNSVVTVLTDQELGHRSCEYSRYRFSAFSMRVKRYYDPGNVSLKKPAFASSKLFATKSCRSSFRSTTTVILSELGWCRIE